MAENDETPVGCTAPLKKLNEDLIDGADKKIIDKDVENYKKCLEANQPDSE